MTTCSRPNDAVGAARAGAPSAARQQGQTHTKASCWTIRSFISVHSPLSSRSNFYQQPPFPSCAIAMMLSAKLSASTAAVTSARPSRRRVVKTQAFQEDEKRGVIPNAKREAPKATRYLNMTGTECE